MRGTYLPRCIVLADRISCRANQHWRSTYGFYCGDVTFRVDINLKYNVSHDSRGSSDRWIDRIDVLFQMRYCLWTGYCKHRLRGYVSNA